MCFKHTLRPTTPTGPTSGPGKSSGACSVSGGSPPCPPPEKVTVTITLDQPVACPGHPLQLTATGKPGGGTYAWSLSGDGELVDAAGKPASAGHMLYLRCFKPDDATGNIPERTATVKVTYTHPKGTATDSKEVKTHKIDFDVTNQKVVAGRVAAGANEIAAGVTLWNLGPLPEISTNPKVKIQLDASCPRKTPCAKNHRVGWLQTMLTNHRWIRYRHTLMKVWANTPIRDVWHPDSLRPFYHAPFVRTFAGDGDQKTAQHQDSPSQPATWTDPRPTAPAPPPLLNQQLRWIQFSNSFTAWLVVQNIEWAAHDKPGSFVYLGNFDWSMHLDVAVDTTKAVGTRCTPQSRKVKTGALSKGKGGSSPVLSNPFFNTSYHTKTTPEPPV